MILELEFSMQTVFQLANIEKTCFGKDAWSINALIGEFNNRFSHLFACKIDDSIVGYVCVRIMYEEAQICNVAVLPEHRRKGIATQLLDAVAAFAKEEGCERSELEVNVENLPAVELYRKCGYKEEGIRKNFYRKSRYESRDAYTMVLSLIENPEE